MKPFTKQTILPYLKANVFEHLDFVHQGKLQGFKIATGGLVSQVYRLVVDGVPFYIKQVIPGAQKYLEILDAPDDFNLIFNDQRQIYEAKALRIFEKAVGCGIAPHIYYHDLANRILVLSEVGGAEAKLFVDVIHKEISLKGAAKLAMVAVKLANNTYGKTEPLRSAEGDKKVKAAKLKYQCLEVYSNLDPKTKELVKARQTRFVRESMKVNKVLVHGEYHPRNILVQGDDVATVDLEEAHLGDPGFDIGILLGSYLLAADFYEKVRRLAIKAALRIIDIFTKQVQIPEDKCQLEERIKKHTGGLMLARIDGISSKWEAWPKDEAARRVVRNHAIMFILDDKTSFPDIIKKTWR